MMWRTLRRCNARDFMRVEESHIVEYLRYLDRHPSTTRAVATKPSPERSGTSAAAPAADLTPLAELLPGAVEGVDLAYKFQDMVIEKQKGLGVDVSVWKVGGCSKSSMKMWNISEPFVGPVFSSFFFQHGAEISISKYRIAAVEMEFAFRVAAHIAEEHLQSPKRLLQCVDVMYPSIEFVGTRFPHRAPHAPGLISDMAGNSAFVLGPPCDAAVWKSIDLSQYGCVLLLNDEPIATGRGDAVLGNPLLPLGVLSKNLKSRGRADGVPVGTIVSTGTVSGATPVRAGVLCANFGPLGKVAVTIVP